MPRWPKRKERPGVDRYGRTPLWYHAAKGDLAGVRLELSAGADPSAGDDAGYTPLHVAVQEGQVGVIRLLLAAGADPRRVDRHGAGPLWTAAFSAPAAVRNEIAALLVSAGADPDEKSQWGPSLRDTIAEKRLGIVLPPRAGAVEQTETNAVPDPAG
jgi:ankyrin repeat protein